MVYFNCNFCGLRPTENNSCQGLPGKGRSFFAERSGNGVEKIANLKKIICLCMSLMLCSLMFLNVSAFENENGEAFLFVSSNGLTIQYYLDENNNPYHYINGEKVYLILPLSHLQVNDDETIDLLNQSIQNTNANIIMPRAVPTGYFDLSNCANNQNSREYVKYMFFNKEPDLISTQVLKYNMSHAYICFQTRDIDKGWFSSSNINFIYYYYSYLEDRWYSMSYFDYDARSVIKLDNALNTFPYGQFKVNQRDRVISCNFVVWTTYIW